MYLLVGLVFFVNLAGFCVGGVVFCASVAVSSSGSGARFWLAGGLGGGGAGRVTRLAGLGVILSASSLFRSMRAGGSGCARLSGVSRWLSSASESLSLFGECTVITIGAARACGAAALAAGEVVGVGGIDVCGFLSVSFLLASLLRK